MNNVREIRAVMRPTEIVAACPIGGICTEKKEKSKDWRICGHYDGSVRDRQGFRVLCKFVW
jgi:hypothetical protein